MDKIKILLINPDLKHVSERFIEPTYEAFAVAMGEEDRSEISYWHEMSDGLPGDEEAYFRDNPEDGSFTFKLGLTARTEAISGIVGIHGGEVEDVQDDGPEIVSSTMTPKDLQQKIVWG